MSTYIPERYASRQARGLCPKCGSKPMARNRKWCRRCLDRQNANKRAAYVPVALRPQVAKVPSGLCILCRQNPPMRELDICWCCTQVKP